jgi:formamidase
MANSNLKSISINRAGRLRDEPHTGHNRWHPDIPPVIVVSPGETLHLETRDAADGQIRRGMSIADLDGLDRNVGHPLTGPVKVVGAEPGDVLAIEYLDIVPQPYGWSRVRPGIGFLRDLFPDPFLVHWDIKDGWATSEQIPGVWIPQGAFMGTAGVAPSLAQIHLWSTREDEYSARGGLVLLPEATDAVPAEGPVATDGLRTMPPRENGGNMDIKQLTKGSTLYLPVAVDGALFSTGDAHFAQGDSECCVTAIEMGASVTLRFSLLKGEAKEKSITSPRFAHSGYFADPKWAAPHNFIATVGMPIRADGGQEGEDLTLAARNALIDMIALLVDRGFTREQAYVLCSVAVDLRISNVVDLPNVLVSALLPEAVFTNPHV